MKQKVRDVKVKIGGSSVGKILCRSSCEEICAKVAPNSLKILLTAKLDTLGIRA